MSATLNVDPSVAKKIIEAHEATTQQLSLLERIEKNYEENPFLLGIIFEDTEEGKTNVIVTRGSYCVVAHPDLEVRDAGGVRAVFAKRDIKKGTTLLSETPFIRFTGTKAQNKKREISRYAEWVARRKEIMASINTRFKELLPREFNQHAFDMANDIRERLKGKMSGADIEFETELAKNIAFYYTKIARNSFIVNSDSRCVYTYASNINHSCEPNSDMRFGSRNDFHSLMIIKANTDIKTGQEVLISYIPVEAIQIFTNEERKTYIKNEFGFDCKCKICSIAQQTAVEDQVQN
jgi:hypothetical protein